MVESNKILNDENLVSHNINTFLTNVTKSLGIEDNYPSPCYLDDNTTPITKIINTYSNHPSTIKIKENTKIKETFSLHAALEKDIKDIIDGIVPSKGISSTIPPKLLKMNNDICHKYITNIYNNTLIHTSYLFDLKKGEITPVHKKDETTNKENYRPISILPTVSKIVEKILYSQIYAYFNRKLSANICGFRKGYGPQYALLPLLEKFKKSLDNRRSCGALLTDLSKAFDCLNHNLLIAKLLWFRYFISTIHYKLFDRQSSKNQSW